MVRIACCQIDPKLGDPAANAETIEAQIREAVKADADVIVLPELATCGYMFAESAASANWETTQSSTTAL